MGRWRAHAAARPSRSRSRADLRLTTQQRPRRPQRTLVVNADDLGFAAGVNRGIIEAHEAGGLSSASMMVNTPAFAEAVALVRDRGQMLGVGLHLNLVVGRPLTAVPTLTDARTGDFLPLGELARRAIAGRVRAADVRRECDAQIAALAAQGVAMTHLDSHRHSHALPGILPAVVASARAASIRIVRRPLDRPLLAEPVVSAKMLALHAAWRVAISAVPAADHVVFARVAHFRGIALQGAPDLESKLLALLDVLPGGVTELMLHPGYDDATLAGLDPYLAERERELSVLTSGVLSTALDRGAIRLATFGAV